ncbi:family 10 glycosylhydrolase [bacterium]|nr:family 10 glycosylhydrolase [bacterium]
MPLNRSTTLFCLIAMSLSLSVAAEKGEIRALWADSWNEGFLTPDQTDAFLKDAWAGGYNTVIVEVRKTADAYYRSTLEPRATNLAGDYDALDDILTKAKRPPRGKPALNVQAWIVVNRIWVGAQKPPKLDPVHLVNAHPDWLMKNDKGEVCNTAGENHMYQDPAHPGVVEHTAAVVRELVSKYPVDAVHLDYIRYPGRDWGYSEAALARFARATGKTGKPAPGESAWKDWRREQNDLLVRRIAAEARSARPGVVLSAAVVTWGGTHGGRFEETDAYAGALQNWPRWCNEGWMDEVPDELQAAGTTGPRARLTWIGSSWGGVWPAVHA